MTTDLLEPVASLEEIKGSAVFPPPPPSPSVTNSSTAVKRYFGLSRCRPVSLVCLVPDEIDEQTKETRQTNDDLGLPERFPHVFDWDLAPCAGREILQFEGTVLNAPEPGHFMPQCLEQSSDFTVFPLGQDYFQM